MDIKMGLLNHILKLQYMIDLYKYLFDWQHLNCLSFYEQTDSVPWFGEET